MPLRVRIFYLAQSAGALIAAMLANSPAVAQSNIDRVLAGVDIVAAEKCSDIEIRFNFPTTYAGHFPVDRGTELIVRIEPLGTKQDNDSAPPVREAASVAPGNPAELQSVTYDASGPGPTVRLNFEHTVQFAISRDSDPRHLKVIVAGSDSSPSCLKLHTPLDLKSDLGGGALDTVAEGKKALAANDYQRAVALFTKAVSRSDAATRQKAQELLGLARERAGQLVHAKAEYQSYLKSYPHGAGAKRVRQRLEGVLAASEEAANQEFALKKGESATSTEAKSDNQTAKTLSGSANEAVDISLKVAKGQTALETLSPSPKSDLATKRDLRGPDEKSRKWTWDKYGSIAQFYYRDDGFNGSNLLRGRLGSHDVYQHEVVSSADFTVHGQNENAEIKVRVSGYQENGLGVMSGVDRTSISAAYVEMLEKSSGLSARVGRQTRSSGGVFGRFDGALFGWEIDKGYELKAVVGSPVYFRELEPFEDGRYFYGASLDFPLGGENLSGTVYAIEQDVKSIVDRRAVGGELRYVSDRISAYGGIDYDILYEEFNAAYVSPSWALSKDLTIYGTLDYRHVPFLLTSNALMGQSVDSLSELLDLFGRDEIEQLALDRTATARSAMAGMSYAFSPDWQIALDATVADYSGTPASGGVDEIPDPGTEYYFSAQLNGSNVFTEDDLVGLGLRYLDSSAYAMYIADMNLRYPVTERLRLNPRLRLAYRDSKGSPLRQYMVIPSMGLRYALTNHWIFETEVGARWEDDNSASGYGQNTELLLTAGYRYEF